MSVGPHRLITCLLSLTLAGCAQYGRVRMEFDSATGFDQVATEPSTLEFQPQARRWPWVIRQLEGSGFDVAIATVFAVEPSSRALDNPSGFVRERVAELVDFAGDDIHRTAEIVRRLTWLATNDPQTLDQLVARDGLAAVLQKMQVDPLTVPFASGDRAAEVERRTAWLATLDAGSPERRDGTTLEGEQRDEYVDALRAVAERPSGVPQTDRMTILRLDRSLRDEPDGALREATAIALVGVMENTLSDTMRRGLLAPDPTVREASLLALYRLSGPASVPFALFALTLREPQTGEPRYDGSDAVRRTLLQLCVGVPEEWLFSTFADGPPPSEYIYDTAVRDQTEGLRRVALDGLSRALGRPVSFDRSWADEWWRGRALASEEPVDDRPGPEKPQ